MNVRDATGATRSRLELAVNAGRATVLLATRRVNLLQGVYQEPRAFVSLEEKLDIGLHGCIEISDRRRVEVNAAMRVRHHVEILLLPGHARSEGAAMRGNEAPIEQRLRRRGLQNLVDKRNRSRRVARLFGNDPALVTAHRTDRAAVGGWEAEDADR